MNSSKKQAEDVRLFLSYARQDQEEVLEVWDKLRKVGLNPWIDKKDILPGENWKLSILNAIRNSEFFLIFLSNNSINKRGIIQVEIKEALETWRQKLATDVYFIPIRLDDCLVPDEIAQFQWVDFFEADGFDRLYKSIKIGMERLGIIESVVLRTHYILGLKHEDVQEMVRRLDFFDKKLNPTGKALFHDYEVIEQAEQTIVIDHVTNLMWQQSGSKEKTAPIPRLAYFEDDLYEGMPTYRDYIEELNQTSFAGYSDWRLPNLEEAMSLVDSRKSGELFLSPLFNPSQYMIWTYDRLKQLIPWVVDFRKGECMIIKETPAYVRAVRKITSKKSNTIKTKVSEEQSKNEQEQPIFRNDFLIELFQILDEKFDEEELRTLCFYLDVDYSNLPSDGKINKARELLKHLDRRNLLLELLEAGKQLRPDISWPETIT